MSAFLYKDLPEHYTKKLRAVRDPLDNLFNILVIIEAINSCPDCQVQQDNELFDIAVYTREFNRFFIKKSDGYFSMSNPFQVIIDNGDISFNCDLMEAPVSGIFIAVMRNIIQTIKSSLHSHDEVIISLVDDLSLTMDDAEIYYDTFSSLISEDHGYFRFDDDPDRENKDIHPRYHFDIFYKDSAAIKIGYGKFSELECFLSLADKNKPKKYLVESQLAI